MYDGQNQSLGADFATMTFGQKISRAISLSKQNGLTVFLTTFLGYLALLILSVILIMVVVGSPIALLGAAGASEGLASAGAVGSIFGMLVVSIVIVFLFQFFVIGIYSLMLRYVDGEQVNSVIEVVLSPWRRFGSIVVSVILWLIISFICSIALSLVALIPILGWLVYLAGTLILTMAMTCAMFYIADKGQLNPVDAVMQPFRMVTGKFFSWLGAMVFLGIVLMIPIAIIAAICTMIFGASSGGFIVMTLLMLLYAAVCSIFCFFFMALTYKQSKAPSAMVTGVFD